MTGRGDRPCACDGYDRVRGNVALARLGRMLGVKLDASKPDHELLEELALAVIAQTALVGALIEKCGAYEMETVQVQS